MRSIALEDLDREKQFQLRLQVSLLTNAIEISRLYSDPHRFEPYIRKRIRRINELVGLNGDFTLKYDGRVIYPMDESPDA
ncbi:MAG: hypothetical protein M1533_04255 [Candidatus Thermoplasmatota archaeon]|jgi:hypothetical protein|nr:hypothetical protein [Candidatus Thermoplasmatota archaeon]MCL5793243.1 hypothetical protein [Candidatus Thermoplasmatota archaeon]